MRLVAVKSAEQQAVRRCGAERMKTWNPEKLKTCRAPQPRRFSGFQISRFPLPRAVRPRRPRPSAPLRPVAALVRGDERDGVMGALPHLSDTPALAGLSVGQ